MSAAIVNYPAMLARAQADVVQARADRDSALDDLRRECAARQAVEAVLSGANRRVQEAERRRELAMRTADAECERRIALADRNARQADLARVHAERERDRAREDLRVLRAKLAKLAGVEEAS